MKRFFFFLGLSALLSCSEEHGGMEDRCAPEIRLLQPSLLEATAGDTLYFSIEISDNDQLHDWYFGLNNRTTMTKEIHWSAHWHGQKVSLDTSYILHKDLPYSHFEIQLEASDHQGNTREVRYPILIKGRE